MQKYKLTDEQKLKLNEIADAFICKIEDELMNEIDILDPYLEDGDGEIDESKLTEMVLYIGHYISACSYEST